MPRALLFFAAFTGMAGVTHAAGPDGMFGMVSAIVVQP